MEDYIIYKNDFGDCIVEILDEGPQALVRVEKELINKGYVISRVNGIYIKCFKLNNYEELKNEENV